MNDAMADELKMSTALTDDMANDTPNRQGGLQASAPFDIQLILYHLERVFDDTEDLGPRLETLWTSGACCVAEDVARVFHASNDVVQMAKQGPVLKAEHRTIIEERLLRIGLPNGTEIRCYT